MTGTRLRRALASGAVAALFACGPAAHAANETEVVPFLHTAGGIGFRGEVSQEQFFNGTRLAARNQVRNFVDLDAHFGAWTGLEIYLKASYDTWDRVKWQDVHLNTAGPGSTGGDFVERRKGFSDVWLGTKYNVLDASRGDGDVATWSLETAIKIPGAFKVYPSTDPTVAETDAGTPGFEWLIKTSFSRRVRFADPYVTFFYLNRGSASSSGENVGTFRLADQWGTFFGAELVGFEQRADSLKFSGDVGLGWRWVNDGEMPANRYLYGPDGSNSLSGNVVTEQGYVRYDGRIGFFYQLQKHARASGHITMGLPGDHFIEAYPTGFADPLNGAKIRSKANTDFGYEFSMSAVF